MWDILLFAPFLNGATFGKTTGLFDQKSPYSRNLASYVFFPMVRLFARQEDCLAKSRSVPENLHQKSFSQWCDFLQDSRVVWPKVALFQKTCIRSTFSQWCDFLQDSRVVWPKVDLFQKTCIRSTFFQWYDFLQDNKVVWPKVALFQKTCIKSPFSQWCDFLQDSRVVWPKVALFQKTCIFIMIPSTFDESIVPSSSKNYLSKNDYYSTLSSRVSLTS